MTRETAVIKWGAASCIGVLYYSHFFSVNWCKRQDFPTPMSPMMMYLKMYE